MPASVSPATTVYVNRSTIGRAGRAAPAVALTAGAGLTRRRADLGRRGAGDHEQAGRDDHGGNQDGSQGVAVQAHGTVLPAPTPPAARAHRNADLEAWEEGTFG